MKVAVPEAMRFHFLIDSHGAKHSSFLFLIWKFYKFHQCEQKEKFRPTKTVQFFRQQILSSAKTMLNIEKLRHGPARKFKIVSTNTIQSSKSVKYLFTWVNLGVMSGSIFWDFSKIFKISQMNFWSSQMMSGLSSKVQNITEHDLDITRRCKIAKN